MLVEIVGDEMFFQTIDDKGTTLDTGSIRRAGDVPPNQNQTTSACGATVEAVTGAAGPGEAAGAWGAGAEGTLANTRPEAVSLAWEKGGVMRRPLCPPVWRARSSDAERSLG